MGNAPISFWILYIENLITESKASYDLSSNQFNGKILVSVLMIIMPLIFIEYLIVIYVKMDINTKVKIKNRANFSISYLNSLID